MPNALIWGASGGIGSALAHHLKVNGWNVYGAARDEDRLSDTLDGRFTFEAGDPFSIQQACHMLGQQIESLDLSVYAAGGIQSATLEKTSIEQWHAVMDANLTGAFLTTQAVVPLMSKEGHIMLIGAHTEKITLPRMAVYTAAKTALEPLVTIFQKENRKLKFTLVRPPAIDTPFWQNAPFKLPETALKPQQVAEAILNHYQSGNSGVLEL